MRPGATRIETVGSIWFLDDDANEYLRMPKVEGPRQRGPKGEDWGGPDAGAMQDLVWHSMDGWVLRDWDPVGFLVIFLDEGRERVIHAPLTRDG